MNRVPDKIDNFGNQYWYDEDGKNHNENGYFPAIIYSNGDKAWYKHVKFHNDFGPAVIYNGHKEWFIDGVRLTEQQFKQHKIKNFIYNG